MSPEDMSNRIVYLSERGLTTTVNDIEHMESQSTYGRGIIKVFFHPNVTIAQAVAQISALTQNTHSMPPGTQPPFIIQYDASTVPILQMTLSGPGISEQELYNYATNFIRPSLATVQGVVLPAPFGGKQAQVEVDLNTAALQAKGLAPSDVVNAISNQNLILPAGTSKIGKYEYQVDMNGAPQTIEGINNLPVKTVGNATIYIHDIGNVRYGYPPQTNIVRVNGQRSVLIAALKSGNTSTLDIVAKVKQKLPLIAATLTPDLQIRPFSDQSIFVLAAINGLVREAIIAACLTAFMILVFLGSWRSTLIIAVSIPLSILTSIIVLSALGETINIMTLGGLALAVGILVDDATVEIENINRNLNEGKEIQQAILDGAQQIAVPAFVSTLAICIVFVPMFFLTGVARYLFVPLAEAVVFAMLASYLLSRTLVPTMAKYLLLAQTEEEGRAQAAQSRNPFVLIQLKFEIGFERIRERYRGMLRSCIHHKKAFVVCFLAACALSSGLIPWLGQDFFPSVDAGEFKLHMRAPTGTRVEDTAAICDRVEQYIRSQVPPSELSDIVDNIGLPYSTLNLSYSNSAPIGSWDADITVELKKKHHPTEDYVRRLRSKLARAFPAVTFYEVPVDMISQILYFGLPAPLDIQIVGKDLEANRALAERLLNRLKVVPGAVDLRIQQPFNLPKLHIDVDRTRAQEAGYTQLEIATNLLISLSGSFQNVPTFWLDPKTGVSYNIDTQTPQYRIQSMQDLENVPIRSQDPSARSGILASVASFSRGAEMGVVSHYDIQPVIDIFGSVQGRDLGGVARDMNPLIEQAKKELPRGSQIQVRGVVETMQSSYVGLLAGLAFAILLVYLLIVVNFQSWLDPFIILMGLPAALAGIVWILFVSSTAISVPALTGTIMCMGVATANSILVVSFAKERLMEGLGAGEAALSSGYTRFRPVLMTALAMIIGMLPMSLGMGEGGEENAPLGRAVIGGLMFATVATLFFVPVFFSIVHGRQGGEDVADVAE
jgi:multidrug efflux pump subunit AcrB